MNAAQNPHNPTDLSSAFKRLVAKRYGLATEGECLAWAKGHHCGVHTAIAELQLAGVDDQAALFEQLKQKYPAPEVAAVDPAVERAAIDAVRELLDSVLVLVA